MIVYDVKTVIYDNSHKVSIGTIEVDDIPDSTCQEFKNCDIYHDYFSTLEFAKDYVSALDAI